MRASPPAVFVLGWIGIAAAFEGAAWAYAAGWGPGIEFDPSAAAWWAEFLLFVLAFCFGEAFAQALLLRGVGRPVPGWTARVGGGEGALALAFLLFYLAVGGYGVRTATPWELVAWRLGEDVMTSIGSGLVIGAAVWGRRGEGPWMLWLTGRMMLGPAASLAAWGLQYALGEAEIFLEGGFLSHLLEFVRRVFVAAGESWLLWRLVLPRRPQSAGPP